jgi:putative nucleotidyltransferase with HDIG domain
MSLNVLKCKWIHEEVKYMMHRVKQFYWSIQSKLKAEDKEFLKVYLNTIEVNLFNELSEYEKKHSINVAQEVIKKTHNETVIRAALLHDIGKIRKRINPFSKSILVMLDSISKGKLKKLSEFGIVDSYYNHGDKGYELMKKYINDERLLYLIKNHHNDNIIGDKDLNILKACDDKN